ncbi:hypothetical protein F4Z99_15070 [Candidatus Poribacteria bacterium]|nr:hypothetical protein [Candidatus Poribacteria bacterium]MYB00735.1 hypothetical protein [Candidatus Poribacteria bacterium]
MQTFKNTILLYLLLTFSMTGCVAGLQTQSSPTDVTTATSGVILTLSTPEAIYTSKDTIPIELSIQNGKFDLLVPFVNVGTSGTFAQLKITDTNGNIVEPKRSTPVPSSAEVFIEKDGRSVQCIQGLELKAATTQVVPLEDLQKYYQLEKGDYTITLTMELPVYRDFLKKKHPEVIELEAEIKRIEDVTDAHVSAADKRSAVNDIQQQIEFLEKKDKDIYLPVESLLGKAMLTSNSITLTIE